MQGLLKNNNLSLYLCIHILLYVKEEPESAYSGKTRIQLAVVGFKNEDNVLVVKLRSLVTSRKVTRFFFAVFTDFNWTFVQLRRSIYFSFAVFLFLLRILPAVHSPTELYERVYAFIATMHLVHVFHCRFRLAVKGRYHLHFVNLGLYLPRTMYNVWFRVFRRKEEKKREFT